MSVELEPQETRSLLVTTMGKIRLLSMEKNGEFFEAMEDIWTNELQGLGFHPVYCQYDPISKVYFISIQNKMLGFDVNGKNIYREQIDRKTTHYYHHSWTSYFNGAFYVSYKGTFFRVRPSDGKIVWMVEVDEEHGLHPLCCHSFRIAAGVLVGAMSSTQLLAIDITTGKLMWVLDIADVKIPQPCYFNFMQATETTMFVIANHHILEVEILSGKQVFKVLSLEEDFSYPPSVYHAPQNQLFLIANWGIYALNSKKELLWKAEIKDMCSFVEIKGCLLVGNSGYVYRLDPKNGQKLWKCSLPGTGYGPVTLQLYQSTVLAACGGHLFGLCEETGQILWHNKLKSMGSSYVSLCSEFSPMDYHNVIFPLESEHQANTQRDTAENTM